MPLTALGLVVPFERDGRQVEHRGHGRQHLGVLDQLANGARFVPVDDKVLQRLERGADDQQQEVGGGQRHQEQGGGVARLAVAQHAEHGDRVAGAADQERDGVRGDQHAEELVDRPRAQHLGRIGDAEHAGHVFGVRQQQVLFQRAVPPLPQEEAVGEAGEYGPHFVFGRVQDALGE